MKSISTSISAESGTGSAVAAGQLMSLLGSRDQDLREAFHHGGARWPKLDVEWGFFYEHCSRVLPLDGDRRWTLHGADLYLCCACLARRPGAVEVFEAHAFPRVKLALQRIHEAGEFSEEIQQSLRQRLLVGPPPKLACYAARGPLIAWACVSAARLAVDALRAQSAARRAHGAASRQQLIRHFEDPAAQMQRSEHVQLFEEALEKAFRGLSPADRQLLRLASLEGCSIDQLGRMYSIHRATAARRLERVRGRVLVAVRRYLKDKYGLPTSEFQALAGEVKSQLHVSLSLLADDVVRADG
jgi:RNA polymerase sigma-70 factor (ECF subfamily)